MDQFDATKMFDLFDKFDLPARARQLIVEGFNRPARWTEPTPVKAPAGLCCPKMGIVINTADALEKKAAFSYLFDKNVMGYLDSPFQLHVEYRGKSDKKVQQNFAQGFLVITPVGFFWDEWMSFGRQIASCKSNPYKFTRDGDVVRCPPREEAAQALGIKYRLRSERDLNEVSIRNFEYLRSYLVDEVVVPPWFRSELREYFELNGYSTLHELREAFPSRSKDDFYAAIADGIITTDLSMEFVREEHTFLVFSDQETLESYQLARPLAFASPRRDWSEWRFRTGQKLYLSGNPFTIISAGSLELTLQAADGVDCVRLKTRQVLNDLRAGTILLADEQTEEADPLYLESEWRYASEKERENALRKIELLERWEAGERTKEVQEYSDRSYRTWRKIKADSQINGTDLVADFLPKWSLKGNRSVRIDLRVQKAMEDIIKKNYDKVIGRGKWSVFGDLCRELEKEGLSVSKQTFLKFIVKTRSFERDIRREGRKAAYQTKPFYWTLDRETPVHGDFPMQMAHIDHTPLEVKVISSDMGVPLVQPILTLIMCAFSRRVLGFYLSLISARYISCLAAVLDMIKRYGKVPVGLIFDGGSEFGGLDFGNMCRHLRIDQQSRPASACRYGSILERGFEVLQDDLIHQLIGNTKIYENYRQITPENDPKKTARFTLPQLHAALEEYFFEIYDTRSHGTLMTSPRAKFELELDRTGKRLHRTRTIDSCIPMAFPSVRGQTRTIDCQRGIRTNYGCYRNPRLEHPQFHGLKVPVRYHPVNPKIVYAFVKNEWFPMHFMGQHFDLVDSGFKNIVGLEERLALQLPHRSSRHQSNMEASALIEKFNESATSEFDEMNVDALQEPNEPSYSEEDRVSEKDGVRSIEDEMAMLAQGGFLGTRHEQ
ncbi:integrase catalytic domain-containing protein [Paraburkholderia bannensis]|uniref:integrase catalytic domain-containing protein n=1 Tax=Paraburkholderia bannensis TaxID=765414 RepID=UPI002AB6CDFA|nr:transposase family protein [Paraburkholderia bannensis]